MKNFWFLIVLLLIVVITVSLSSYKIENFTGYDYYNEQSFQSDEDYGTYENIISEPAEPPLTTDNAPSFGGQSYQIEQPPVIYPQRSSSQPYIDNTSPQTPNDMTCYNYIKNVKGWNVDELSKDQLKVLLTMRALQGSQYSADSRVYPYGDGCVIPKEHLPIFNRNEHDLSPLTVRPTRTSNKNTCSNPNDNTPDVQPVNSSVTLNSTGAGEYPNGLKADFKTMDYQKFKDFLQGAYELYDSEFLTEKKRLQAELVRQTRIRDWWNSYRQSLQDATTDYDTRKNALLAYNSACQITTRGNQNQYMPEWNQRISDMNSNIWSINRLWSYLWNGWIQIWNISYNC